MSCHAQPPKLSSGRPKRTNAPSGLLQRQCACGKHTIAGGECEECARKKHTLQPKLAIGAIDDPLEREADRVAEQVLAGPTRSVVSTAPPRIQRIAGSPAQQGMIAPASVDRVLANSGQPLEPALRQDMESRFDHDFSRVRVHTDPTAEKSAQELNANAYAAGHHMVFNSHRYSPGTAEGRRLIAHELTHVVQQAGADHYLARQATGASRTPNQYSPELTPLSPEPRQRVNTLATIAQKFREKIDAESTSTTGRNVSNTGQNFWTTQILDRLEDFIDLWISPESLQNDFRELAHAVAKQEASTAAEARKRIEQNAEFKTDKRAQKLLNTDPDPRSGRELYEEWWGTYRTRKTLPGLAKYLTIPVLSKLAAWENQACGFTVGQVVEVQKSHGGTEKGTRNAKNSFSGEQLSAAPDAPRDPCLVTPGSALGDLVKYKPLKSFVDRMQTALDDGFVIYTHVLSGYGAGSQAPMTDCTSPEQRAKSTTHVAIAGEHYILIIGYENNKFLFWDAHASDSIAFGGGFGLLYFDSSNNRLTTAEHDAHLPVNGKGEQSNGQHRYQPLIISTR